jgi:precorrin-8X/cobalt-precorrin-8 methylmutase
MINRNYIVGPREIEKNSMELIEKELRKRRSCPIQHKVITRVIHATADFDFADILHFNHAPIETFFQALEEKRQLVSDTRMIQMGVSRPALDRLGLRLNCYMSDPDVAQTASDKGITRAMVSMDKAVKDPANRIFIIGNAPTALYRLAEHMQEGFKPALIIGVPVGFVGAAESKECLRNLPVPSITTVGRKGGSTVAAAIVNALLYHYQSESP